MTIDISSIKAGDTVTAKFTDPSYGDFEITSQAYAPDDTSVALDLAGWVLRDRTDGAGKALVEIVSALPAEPPIGVYTDEFSDTWVHVPRGWIRLSAATIEVSATPWVDAPSTYAMTPVTQ